MMVKSVATTGEIAAIQSVLQLYNGELLPEDRYEEWAEERREQLRLRHREVLRLAGRWQTLLELDNSDETAHIALMQQYAAVGAAARSGLGDRR